MATKSETTTKKTTKTAAKEPVAKAKAIEPKTKSTPSIKITRAKTEAPLIVRKPYVPTQEEIAERAYHLFVRRGYTHGHDHEDWMQAEKELLAGK